MYREMGGKSKTSRGIRNILLPGGGLNELYERMKGSQNIDGSLQEAKAEQQRRMNQMPARAPRI
jgi:hypothetical protein